MTDLIIIGGGVLGLLTARDCAGNGLDCLVIEAGKLAQESSWAGGGIISPLYPWRYLDSITRLANWSQAAYSEITGSLFDQTGIDPEYRPSGLLISTPGESRKALDWASTHQQVLKSIDADDFASIEPGYKAPPHEGVWMPDVAQVRNPRFARALIADLRNRSVSIQEDLAITGFEIKNNKVTSVNTANRRFHAECYLVCAGAWTHELLRHNLAAPDIRPVRGQMLLFKAKPGVVRHIVLEENRYAIPRADGRVLFGSTIEETGFDKATTRQARDELYEIAMNRFPALRDSPVEKHWAGLRPGSPAGVPYICRHPEIENLYINAGHFRNGIVLGPASARLATDLILDREPILDPGPYSLTAPRG